MSHAITRTSPTGPGQKFIGKCTKCGQTGLTMASVLKPCPQDHVISDADALINIIEEKDK